jgi:hypothetical protein
MHLKRMFHVKSDLMDFPQSLISVRTRCFQRKGVFARFPLQSFAGTELFPVQQAHLPRTYRFLFAPGTPVADRQIASTVPCYILTPWEDRLKIVRARSPRSPRKAYDRKIKIDLGGALCGFVRGVAFSFSS